MKKQVSAFAMMTLLGVGCGGGGGGGGGGVDEGPAATAGTVNPAAVQSATTSAATMNTAITSGNGDSIAGAALGVSGSAAAAVSPASGSNTTNATLAALTIVKAETATGTKTCDTTGCTYDHYGFGGTNAFTITGSVKATAATGGGTTVVWDLTGTGAFSGSTSISDFNYKWNGNLTVTATSLVGSAGSTWNGSGTSQGVSFTFDYGALIKFNAVVLAGSPPSPTGGSVYVKSWYSVNANGQSQAKAYEGTKVFGS